MAVITPTILTERNMVPYRNALFINGRYAPGAIIQDITINATASVPSTLSFTIPNTKYGSTLISGTNITAFLDIYRRGIDYNNPIFTGYVQEEEQDYDYKQGSRYEAVDFRQRMSELSCFRNFNMKDETFQEPRETLSYRDIVDRIVAQLNDEADLDQDIVVDTSILSDGRAPEMEYEGITIAKALDKILLDASTELDAVWAPQYRLKPTSTGFDSVLSLEPIFRGSGPAIVARYGVYPTVNFIAQGTNTRNIKTTASLDNLVNHVIGYGAYHVVQSIWELSPGWQNPIDGVQEDDIVKNFKKYTEEFMTIKVDHEFYKQEFLQKNPHYLKSADDVSKRYLIPTKNLFYEGNNSEDYTASANKTDQHPEILNRLSDPDQAAFLLFRSTERDPNKYFLKDSGFTIQNNKEIHLYDPLVANFGQEITDEQFSIPSLTKVEPVPPDTKRYYGFNKAGLAKDELKGGFIIMEHYDTRVNAIHTLAVGRVWPIVDNLGNVGSMEMDCARIASIGSDPAILNGQQIRMGQSSGTVLKAVQKIDNYLVTVVPAGGDSSISAEEILKWSNGPGLLGIPRVAECSVIQTGWYRTDKQSVLGNLVSDAEGDVIARVNGLFNGKDGAEVELAGYDADYRFTYIKVEDGDDEILVPDEVFLVACYRDTARMRHDTGRIGDIELDMITRVFNTDYEYEYVEAGSAVRRGKEFEMVTSAFLAKDDSALLQRDAEKLLNTTYKGVLDHTLVFPYCPVISIGSTVRSPDNRLDDYIVKSVSYDGTGKSTTVEVY